MNRLPFRGVHFYAALRKLTTTDTMYDLAPTEEDLTHALQKAIILDKTIRTLTAKTFHFADGTTRVLCIELEELANDAQECMLIEPDGSTFTRRHYQFTSRGAFGILHELEETERKNLTYLVTAINNCLDHRRLGNTQHQSLPEQPLERNLTGETFYTTLRAQTTYRLVPSLEELERAIHSALIHANDFRAAFANEFTFENKDGLLLSRDLPEMRSEALRTKVIEPMGNGVYNFLDYTLSKYTAQTTLEKIRQPFDYTTLLLLGKTITEHLPTKYQPKDTP